MKHPSCYRCSSEWGWRNSAPVRSGLRIVTQPTGEQITLAEAKLHCRVDSYPDLTNQTANAEDALITELIVAAREWCENDIGRALVPQTFEFTTSAWPYSSGWGGGTEVLLPMSPISSVSSVVYLDVAGTPVTLADSAYTLNNWSEPGWLYSVAGTAWPTAMSAPNAITIRYLAGYTLPNGSPADMPLPKSIKSAMLLIVGHLFENREQSTELKLMNLPLAAESLLDRWRLRLPIA